MTQLDQTTTAIERAEVKLDLVVKPPLEQASWTRITTFLLVVLVALTSSNSVSTILQNCLAAWMHPLVQCLAFSAVFMVCTLLLFKHRYNLPRYWLVPAILAVVAEQMVGSSVLNIFHGGDAPLQVSGSNVGPYSAGSGTGLNSVLLIVCLCLLVVALIWLHRQDRIFTGVRRLREYTASMSEGRFADKKGNVPVPIKHLILPLTPPDALPQIELIDSTHKAVLVDRTPEARVRVVLSSQAVTLADDIQKMEEFKEQIAGLAATEKTVRPVRMKWQQMLRAFVPHVNSLQHVWLIGSNGDAGSLTPFCERPMAQQFRAGLIGSGDDQGSLAFLDSFQEVIHLYLPKTVIHKVGICRTDAGNTKRAVPDFENVNQMLNVVGDIHREIKRVDPLVQEGEIAIDVTGGQKLVSIVGALSTLNLATMFQYVSTTSPYDVTLADLRAGHPPGSP